MPDVQTAAPGPLAAIGAADGVLAHEPVPLGTELTFPGVDRRVEGARGPAVPELAVGVVVVGEDVAVEIVEAVEEVAVGILEAVLDQPVLAIVDRHPYQQGVRDRRADLVHGADPHIGRRGDLHRLHPTHQRAVHGTGSAGNDAQADEEPVAHEAEVSDALRVGEVAGREVGEAQHPQPQTDLECVHATDVEEAPAGIALGGILRLCLGQHEDVLQIDLPGGEHGRGERPRLHRLLEVAPIEVVAEDLLRAVPVEIGLLPGAGMGEHQRVVGREVDLVVDRLDHLTRHPHGPDGGAVGVAVVAHRFGEVDDPRVHVPLQGERAETHRPEVVVHALHLQVEEGGVVGGEDRDVGAGDRLRGPTGRGPAGELAAIPADHQAVREVATHHQQRERGRRRAAPQSIELDGCRTVRLQCRPDLLQSRAHRRIRTPGERPLRRDTRGAEGGSEQGRHRHRDETRTHPGRPRTALPHPTRGN